MFDREKEIEYKNYRVGSLRLPEFDYTQPGFYFVTIVTHKHKSLFGKIINEKVVLSDFGNLITEYWLNIPIHFDNVKLDEFIVMPNHIHGIIQLIDDPSINVETQHAVSLQEKRIQKFGHVVPKSLPVIVRSFKSATTKKIRSLTNKSFVLWQKNYYEHIIRNEKELFRIRKYIVDNPIKWELDKENPKNIKSINTGKTK